MPDGLDDLTERQAAVFISTYEHLQASILENEALGERRVQLHLAVTAALAVAVGATLEGRVDSDAELLTIAFAAAASTGLGLLTVLRVIRRNVKTTEWLQRLSWIRREIFPEPIGAAALLPFPPWEEPEAEPRNQSTRPRRGGILEISALTTALTFGVAVYCLVATSAPWGLAMVAAAVGAIALWWGQVKVANHIYEDSHTAPGDLSVGFRAGVGAVILDPSGQPISFQRVDHPLIWQFPQGGISGSESPEEAVRRELQEELGLKSADFVLADGPPEWLTYDLPREFRTNKTGRGQTQQWFVATLRESPKVLLDNLPQSEFTKYKQTTFDELISETNAFRQPTYRRLQEWIRLL